MAVLIIPKIEMLPTKLPKKLSESIKHLSDEDRQKVSQAYLFACKKHKGQKRRSGDDYITHPVDIAIQIAKSNYDTDMIISALLHDTIEDTDTSLKELADNFGQSVAKLVDGVTKVANIRTKSKRLSNNKLFLDEVDNYRKLLLATASDVRVIIIRLYDRLDNIKTLQFISPEKRQFYAQETIEIYAPIAERLGMGVVKGQLEDLSFPYAYPKEYESFIKIALPAYKSPNKVITEAIPLISKQLESNKITHTIAGRTKHLYSLYNKFKRGKSIENIFDIAAIRVIVTTVEECYKTLGLIHSLYTPLPGQIDDYIARPKENGYQSLHTKVRNIKGEVFEVQIRTRAMHEVNEFGPTAHWNYKDSHTVKNMKLAAKNRDEWLKELSKVKDVENNKDFLNQIKEEFFSKKIFVFSPKGKIVKLPSGATCIDFAYQIHTELGNSCNGVKINNRLMPISTPLQTGDVVEIITSKKSFPSRDWLKIAKSSYARHRIRSALKEKNFDQLVSDGEGILNSLLEKVKLSLRDRNKESKIIAESKLPHRDLPSALAALAEGTLNKTKLLKTLFPNSLKQKVKRKISSNQTQANIESLKNIRHTFAGCCKAKVTDNNLIGYLNNDHTINVHKKDCKRIANVDQRRLIKI